MSLHTQGRIVSSTGTELNPTFPIDPLQGTYQVNNTPVTPPNATITSYPTLTGIVTSAIASGVATTIATINCANVNTSAISDLFLRVACTGASHLYDSTRVGKFTLAISRVAGSALVATLSSVYGAAIATSGSDTLTFTLGLAAVAGAVTAPNTIAIQITVTESATLVSEAQLTYTLQNGGGAAISMYGPSIS